MLGDVAKLAMLDQAKIDECLKDGQASAQISQEQNLAGELSVVGTPTFLLGKTQPVGAEGTIIAGAPSLESLEEKIQALLSN